LFSIIFSGSFTGLLELTFVPEISNFVIGLYSRIIFSGTVVVLKPDELILVPKEVIMLFFFSPVNKKSSPITVDPALANVPVRVVFEN